MSQQQPSGETRQAARSSQQQNSPANLNKRGDELLKNFELRMKKQFDEIKSMIMDVQSKLTDNLEKLNKIVCDFTNRFQMLGHTVSALTERMQLLEGLYQCTLVNQVNSDVSLLSKKIDQLERESIANDAVIYGVPKTNTEDLREMFSKLCTSTNCTPSPVAREIFRVKPKGTSEDTAIIVKFINKADKYNVLKSIN